jgi:hypothetical protein
LGYHYLLPFNVHAVERAVAEHPRSILILGEFHAVCDDPNLFARVRQALWACQHVVLLLPSPDVEESLRVLEERGQVLVDGREINEHFVRHPSNHDLARYVFYTKGRSPEET